MERLYDVAEFLNKSSIISLISISYGSFEYLHHTRSFLKTFDQAYVLPPYTTRATYSNFPLLESVSIPPAPIWFSGEPNGAHCRLCKYLDKRSNGKKKPASIKTGSRCKSSITNPVQCLIFINRYAVTVMVHPT